METGIIGNITTNMELNNSNEIGPFHVCLTCLKSDSKDITYCQTNENILGSFDLQYTMKGERCFIHKNVVASTYCVLCGRPICKECIV